MMRLLGIGLALTNIAIEGGALNWSTLFSGIAIAVLAMSLLGVRA
jgi:hypothetical protein